MKISEMIISAVLKKGILYEARDCDLEFEVPFAETPEEGPKAVLIRCKIDHMTIKIEKD